MPYLVGLHFQYLNAKTPSVLNLTIISAARAAKILHELYPHDHITVEPGSNALVVFASPDDVTEMRSVLAGIDVRSPLDNVVDAIPLRFVDAATVERQITPLIHGARIARGPNRTLIVSAPSATIAQIHAIINAIDAPPTSPSPKPLFAPTIVHLKEGDPLIVSRAVARTFPSVNVSVSGSNLVLRGQPDAVSQAAAASAQLDQPRAGTRYTEVYRLTAIDARSVAALLSRSFSDIGVDIDHDLNAITVLATAHVQQRVANAINQLDNADNTRTGSGQAAFNGGEESDVIFLHAAVPGPNGGASTSAADIATAVTQSIGQANPDLKLTVPANSTKIILTGSQHSVENAKALIAKLDVAEPLVELDTEVLEVDESVQKQLGLKFPTPVLSTTYSEIAPVSQDGASTPQLLRLQPLTRTPLTLGAELDFLVSTSKARILEDPRITTFSGRTASLRAGETVNILTTAGGGTGTVATTQVQSFQTGVTLDITPVVNADDYVTVTLHPSVNSEAGVSAAGVPNIQTRDTTTTIGLHDGETIVVGGLIEDEDSKTIQKIPLLGDLPLIGKLFQDTSVSKTRNELIVTVTPHILRTDLRAAAVGMTSVRVPVAEPLPTLAASATLPPLRATASPPEQTGYSLSALINQPGPSPIVSPIPTQSPNAQPSAFAQTNTYTFGAAPINNFAGPGQPPQIFFVQASPTVIKAGQSIVISAITTTNVSSVTFGNGTAQQALIASAPGKWQGTIVVNSASLQSTSGNVNEQLTATTSIGASTMQRIPFTLTP